MNQFFINDDISEEQKKLLHKVLDLGIDFLDGNIRQGKALNYLDMGELKQKFSSEIPTDSSDYDSLYSMLHEISKYSISQSAHTFLAFPDSAGSLATYCADIIASFLNQNLIAVDRSAPVATYVEAQLIAWLRYLIGYSDTSINQAHSLSEVGGMWTTGGNMSNHIAILTALLTKFPEIMNYGLCSLEKRPVIIVSKEIAHYSFLAAARILGIGSENVVWAETTREFTSDVDSIKYCLDHLNDDCVPFMVVAVAGNCRTSAIDDLYSIAKICEEKNIWFHVDACHGGSLLFSNSLKSLLRGIEVADSVTIDPHKGLFTTYSSSYVLFKDTSVMNKYCRYPEKTLQTDIFDLGLITPFYGSRGFESLKLWLLIKHLGVKKIGEIVEQRNNYFSNLTAIIDSTGYFCPLSKSTFYRAVYVFYPDVIRSCVDELKLSAHDIKNYIDKYTVLFSEKLYTRGNVIFDLFSLKDVDNSVGLGNGITYKVIGVCCGHAEMSIEDFRFIEKEIRIVSEKIQVLMLNELKGSNLDIIEPKSLESGPASW